MLKRLKAKIKSGEIKHVEIKNLVDNLIVDDIELKSDINIFDQNTYLPVGS